MIDVENYVIDKVAQSISYETPPVQIYSSHVRTPSTFPCVMIYESSNTTFEGTRTVDGVERHAEVRYTIEICTNDTTGKKENAKRLMRIIDDAMQEMGFYRASRQYTFGTNESSVFVALTTYRGLVGEAPSSDDTHLMVYRR